ncbi:2'-5' RNA ligase family protein [Brachybacterium sp. GCM10030252]|uniref:2'-5' RNA ligase family protein n=1 Tax=Brachybacterium sp. GCM10030252 TaxID=3273380 RepID=UPI00360AE246
MMRVFVSIRPSPDALDHLASALDEVRSRTGLSLRWGDAAQWHLTLAFRPHLPDGAVDGALASLAEVAARHEPMDLQLSGAGTFSSRTLWIGVGGEVDRLGALMSEQLLGEEDGERRRAHLTVARVSARAPRARRRRSRWDPPQPDPTQVMLADAVHALSVYRGPMWRTDEIQLVTSRLGQGRSGGPLHEVLGAVPLGG